jgi:hypothetical protein
MKAKMGDAGQTVCDSVAKSLGACTYTSGVCACDKALDSKAGTKTDSGTYSVSGSQLTMKSDSSGSEATSTEFCVSGTKATFNILNKSDAGSAVSHVILEKK